MSFMDSNYEQNRLSFQGRLDSTANGETLHLVNLEIPGPVVINHPLVLDGRGATIWAYTGPVISCQSDGIVLRNVKIEVTGTNDAGRSEDACALWVKPSSNVRFENVEVRGSVIGLWEEEGAWRYPHALPLGPLPFGSEHDLIIRVYVPVACEISSSISGVELQPHELAAGTNEIHLHVERLPQDTLLNGSLFLITPQLRRRITVSAHITSARAKKSSRSKKTVRVVWQPDDWDTLVNLPPPPPPGPRPAPQEPPVSKKSPPFNDPWIISPTISPVITPEIDHKPPPNPLPETVASPPIESPLPDSESQKTLPVNGRPEVVMPSFEPDGPYGEKPSKPDQPDGPGGQRWRIRTLPMITLIVAALIFLGLAATVWRYFSGPEELDPVSIKPLLDAPFNGHTAPVNAVAFSPDGKIVASSDGEKDAKNGTIKLWDASTGKPLETPPMTQEGAVISLAFSPDGTLLVSGSRDIKAVLWDVQTGKKVNIPLRGVRDPFSAIAFSPDGKYVVTGETDAEGTVRFYDSQNGQQDAQVIKHQNPLRSIALSPDGTLIATGAEDGSIKLWNAITREFKQSLPIKNKDPITSLAFSHDSKTLASGCADKKIILWDAQKGSYRSTLDHHKAGVSSVAFSADDKHLVSGGLDGIVILWDVAEGVFKRALTNHQGAVNSVAVSSRQTIASASADKTVILWGNK